MKNATAKKVRDELYSCVVRTLERIETNDETYRPFHGNLLSEKIIKLSAFERSFSTSLGQSVFEKISKLIAEDVAGTTSAATQRKTTVELTQNCSTIIENHIEDLRQKTLDRAPSWRRDIALINNTGDKLQHRVISDLWYERDGVEYFFSIKTVKPNLDQTSEAKRDMLKLYAHNPNFKVYFALPYNPFGEQRKLYDHSFPQCIFDMQTDDCVLIGRDYWDFIGGENTYRDLLYITEEVGKVTRELLKEL